ncbi:MAG: hypothetical protein KIT70_03510 [Anaerolineales bacterium]|nr:MAG: hypothetical protein KIT70_03510 [Anaerolineales bacterium]
MTNRKGLLLGIAVVFALGTFAESFQIAWGSGFFIGRLSLKWLLTLLGCGLLLAALLWVMQRGLGQSKTAISTKNALFDRLDAVPGLRWLLTALVVVFPWYFIYYSSWGSLFTGFFTRTFLYGLAVLSVALLLTRERKVLLTWRGFLLSLLFVAVGLVIGDAFVRVTNYPLALHWSEGNRLWDYSLLFGRERYNYPAGEPIFAWIDRGRQTLWGLPFLWDELSISGARAWSALMTTLPYALLGWFAFRPIKDARWQWFLAGLWALIFLNQGPIYAPLILGAILVAFARRRSLLIAIPLVALAGAYVAASRFTWTFAPAIWAVMLSLSDAAWLQGRLRWQDWARAFVLSVSGLWSAGLPIISGILASLFAPAPTPTGVVDATPGAQGVSSVQALQATVTSQPFAWERMLPNDVFPPGIMLGLLAAAGPLLLLMLYLVRTGHWKTTSLQRIVVLGGLGAFLVVGLIASAKVGGGADLHNLDMLLVTLVLLAGVAWEAGLHKHLAEWVENKTSVQAALTAMLLIPAMFPLYSGAPLNLPDEERLTYIMERIDANVACAAQYGPILFLDQRQLLTFRYQTQVALHPEYEKKYVMDQALSANQVFFEGFAADLAQHKYALIVGELEDTVFRGRNPEYGDSLIVENNAWKRWVSIPLLRYYESVHDFQDAGVETFMPIGNAFECP